ncbi:methylenetetrahydrofolate reductase [NAD(P)H] [Clostridium gasigenes]|uniref:methylenetetrahydrofolate reductase [NAD(P)H] n=1 Tax=Clostridium gasigenes TaxID=94869 RepID=UPI0014385DBA|nr:methylenetetrahydrofolate reductase [NAD(P)H] [Clostridium gasigenes]NKF06187.1 methylenetetrahydrofolate reductase [NAD(P)H] [Clostridium gasigenes]QSW20074.1 methylenetetrahydrofolate reductase [NAD(P)H] [Clostridium gasigenes]
MNIRELFEKKNLVFSFEIFPPKVSSSVETIYNTLEELKDLTPDYISVTYGAGGSLTENRTCELSSLVKSKYGIESLAHLTCINSTKEEIDFLLRDLKNAGIENILALRGDMTSHKLSKAEFNYASELVNHIKRRGDFNIVGACYPEGHIDCKDLDRDILNLKLKEEAGASHFISQLFFDNNYFYDFLEKKEKYNIKSPIQAGIMPVINKKQVERITSLCGTNIPKKFLKIMDRYEHNKEALRDAGIAYAIEQMVDLISSGVDGIHLYTMNNPYVAKRINGSISSIINSVNNGNAI